MRYWPRTSRLLWRFAYSIASFASMILRSRSRVGLEMQRLRTSCWVIVEPPSTVSPASRFFSAARAMPSGSIPPCSKKRSSSIATVPCCTRPGMRLIETGVRASSDSTIAEPAAVAGVEDRVAALLDRPTGGERGSVGGDVEHPGGDSDRRHREQGDDAEGDEEELAARSPPVALTSAVALRHRKKGIRAAAPTRPLRLRCRRWRGCARSPRPASGWGSRPRCRRRG